jgi:signal transduction histidine kinase
MAEIQSWGSGVGIRGMRERLRQFRGTLNIESGTLGTRISVVIPVPLAPATEEREGNEAIEAAV